MRRTCLLLSFCITLIAPAVFAISNTGLIAHWPLDGNGADASGNGNNLTLIDASAGANRLGAPSSAIEMDANATSLSLADGPATDLTSQFTWAGWVRFDRIGTDNDNFVAKSCCSSNVTTMFYADTYAYDGSQPHYNQIRFFVTNGGGNYGFEHAGPILENHRWYHIALVYDGPAATMKVYVDGVLTDSLTNTGAGGINDVPSSLNDVDAAFTMGRIPVDGPTGSMQGALDDVWWFSRVLSPAEIAALADVGGCQANIDALEAQVATLTQQHAQLSSQVASLTADNAQLTAQVSSLTQQNAQLNAQVATLTQQNAQLTSQVASLTQQNTSLTAQVASLTQQNAALTSQVATLSQQNATLQQQVQSVANGLASIESAMRVAFNDPTFVIPGATTVDKNQALVAALLNLSKGQLQAIYKNLGGK